MNPSRIIVERTKNRWWAYFLGSCHVRAGGGTPLVAVRHLIEAYGDFDIDSLRQDHMASFERHAEFTIQGMA